MSIPKIPESEYRFCLILWEQEPIAATEMVKLCQDIFQRALYCSVVQSF